MQVLVLITRSHFQPFKGLEAGTKFLQSVMDEMNDTEEGEELLKSIRTSFTKTNCMIMRHPGPALRSDDFEGQSYGFNSTAMKLENLSLNSRK